MEVSLSDKCPVEDKDSPDPDHLYREIVEGVYYPVKDSDYMNGKKTVGFFCEEKNIYTFIMKSFSQTVNGNLFLRNL